MYRHFSIVFSTVLLVLIEGLVYRDMFSTAFFTGVSLLFLVLSRVSGRDLYPLTYLVLVFSSLVVYREKEVLASQVFTLVAVYIVYLATDHLSRVYSVARDMARYLDIATVVLVATLVPLYTEAVVSSIGRLYSREALMAVAVLVVAALYYSLNLVLRRGLESLTDMYEKISLDPQSLSRILRLSGEVSTIALILLSLYIQDYTLATVLGAGTLATYLVKRYTEPGEGVRALTTLIPLVPALVYLLMRGPL